MKLELKRVVCGYGSRTVLRDISFSVREGEVLCLLGPNGVGKTTLFKTILGFLKLQGGEILLNGENIRQWSRERLAKAIGYVPQAHTPPFPFTVLDVVTMGRTAHLGAFASPSRPDVLVAERAIETLEIGYLRDRIYTELSGGERQMVLIARALTQEPEILVMDEPTSNLDFGNQVRVLERINELARNGFGIIMTSHFPDHAFLCSTQIVLLQKGNRVTVGRADEVITEANLAAAYGVATKIIDVFNGREDIKVCVPLLRQTAVPFGA
jgi:iron complex transport system ATP-binding protein